MKAYWAVLSEKIDVLNHRERVMVLIAMVVVLVALLNALMIDPVSMRNKKLAEQTAGDQTQIALMQQQIQLLESSPVVDPDAQNRRRLEELQARLIQADQSLDTMQRSLVSPDRMSGLLEDILRKNGQLKLVSLRTLPTDPALAANPAKPADAANSKPEGLAVYRHGVELTVQGRYLDLMHYVATLEKMPWHMLWGNMKLTTDAFPQSTLTLTIYTLSLDQAWLSI